MRIAVDQYADGSDYMYETTNDGSVVTREWGRRGKPGKRLSAFLDVTYVDHDEKGVEHLLEALSWLSEEVERRKQGLAEKKEKTKPRKDRKTARMSEG